MRVGRRPTRSAVRAILAAVLAGAGPASAADFAVDPNHTAVHFAASHEDLSYLRGSFRRIKGTAQLDPAAQTGSLTISVATATIDTGNSAVDNVLRSGQFLDAERYPEVHFVGDRFVFDGDKLTAIEGRITLHGVQRPLRLVARRFQCREVPVGIVRSYICGGEFQATLKRSEFGMTRFLPEVGDEVELIIDGEATRQ